MPPTLSRVPVGRPRGRRFAKRSPLLAALMMLGCATGGTLVTPSQLAAFKPGETRYDSVAKALGPPTTVTTAPDGTRIAIYSYEHAQTRATTFVPVLGGFIGGTDVNSAWTVCYFDRADVLERCELTASRGVVRPLGK